MITGLYFRRELFVLLLIFSCSRPSILLITLIKCLLYAGHCRDYEEEQTMVPELLMLT